MPSITTSVAAARGIRSRSRPATSGLSVYAKTIPSSSDTTNVCAHSSAKIVAITASVDSAAPRASTGIRRIAAGGVPGAAPVSGRLGGRRVRRRSSCAGVSAGAARRRNARGRAGPTFVEFGHSAAGQWNVAPSAGASLAALSGACARARIAESPGNPAAAALAATA